MDQLVDQLKEDFEVRTMPQKFLNMQPSFKAGKKSKSGKPIGFKKNLIIGIIAIVVLGALMALAAWLFLRSLDNKATPESALTPAAPAAEPTPQQEPQPTPPQKTLAAESLLDFDAWLTYQTPDYYFQLDYPQTWQPQQLEATEDILYRVAFKDDKSLEHFKITIFNNSQQQSLLDWLESLNISQNNLESYTLSNQPAYLYQADFAKLFNIYAAYGQYLYSLEFQATDDPALNKVHNQILITYQFTGTPPPLDLEEQEPQFISAVDSDNDGLTDREEELYGSDSSRSDTDGDSYTDGDEIANLYHPVVAGGARIYESSLVATYLNPDYNYNLIYPSAWQVKGSLDSVLFQDTQGEFIQVFIQPNNGFSNIMDWYQANISTNISQLSSLTVAGQSALRSSDGLRVYFLFGDNIYNLIYNIGLRDDTNFMTTFDMIIKSFKLMSN